MSKTVKRLNLCLNQEELKVLENLTKIWKCNQSWAVKHAMELVNFHISQFNINQNEESKIKEIKDDIHRT